MAQAQPRPNYGAGNSARQLPDYQVPFHGIDPTLIPGYEEQAPIDFNQWYNTIFGGGGNRGGGGGGGTVPGSTSGANDYLNNLFSGGIEGVGQLDPNFINNIFSLQGDMGGNYGDFNQSLAALGSQYNKQIGGTGQNLLDYLMGSMGNTPVSGGGGGGGGGVSTMGIGGILASLPEFQAREIRTGLPELDAALAEEMNVIKQSQLADFENIRAEQNSELMTQLFGRGVQRSTVAGSAVNRANESQERTRLAILSEDVARRLGIRKDEADRILAGDLGSLSSEAQTFGDRLRALTGMYGSEMGAQASAAASSASAGASAAASAAGLEGDRLRALSSIYGSQVGGLQSLFGSQVGGMSSGFNTQQGAITNFADLFGNLALGGQRAEIDKILGLGGIGANILGSQNAANAQLGSARINANAQRQLGTQQNQLGFLNWMNDVQGRWQEGLMGQEGFDLQRELAQLQGDVSRYGARQGAEASGGGMDWSSLIGSLAMAYASYASDENMKFDIHPYENVSITPEEIMQITPIMFKYYHDPEVTRSGILAQEVERILPDAIEEINGFKHVKYDMLMAAVVKGYRDFVEQMEVTQHAIRI